MRIISPFHDYYDNAMAFGQDTTVVYNRVPKIVESAKFEGITLPWQNDSPSRLHIKHHGTVLSRELVQGFILLAGKPYAVWVPWLWHSDWWHGTDFHDPRKLYGSDNPVDLLDKDEQMVKEASWPRRDEYRANFLAFLQRTDLDQLHPQTGSPLILLFPTPRATTLVTDFPLLCFNLQRHVHAFEAFQGISQYIEGVIPRAGKEMVQLSDKEILHKHGFDPQYGFRKLPEQP